MPFIYNGLPNLHPAKWDGKLRKEILVPWKAFTRPDGKSELKQVKKFKFSFHGTDEQLRSETQQKQQQASQMRKQLRNEFTTTISLQLYLKAVSMTKSYGLSSKGFWTILSSAIFNKKE